MRRWIVGLGCWMTAGMVTASEIVQCDPADPAVPNRVIRHERSANTQPAWLSDPTFVVNPTSTPPIADRYWKCDAGGLRAMSSAEQAALDAPVLAQQARAIELETERSTNPLCAATLSELDGRIDAAVSTITDLASAKSVIGSALKQLARCLQARTGGGTR